MTVASFLCSETDVHPQRQMQHPLFEITCRLLHGLRPELLEPFVACVADLRSQSQGQEHLNIQTYTELVQR